MNTVADRNCKLAVQCRRDIDLVLTLDIVTTATSFAFLHLDNLLIITVHSFPVPPHALLSLELAILVIIAHVGDICAPCLFNQIVTTATSFAFLYLDNLFIITIHSFPVPPHALLNLELAQRRLDARHVSSLFSRERRNLK